MRQRIYNLVMLTATLLLVACHSTPTNQQLTDTITDDYGRTLTVPTHPQRVVSLSPAVTEIMFAIGADSLLVGRTDFCAYPPEATTIPSIGGISNLSIERIVGMNPDIVISGSMVSKKAADQMELMGTPMVCIIEKPRFEALYDNIRTIGRLVGHTSQADSLVQAIEQRYAKLPRPADTLSDNDIPSVYYVVGFGAGGNFTAGGNTFINDIIRMAGGRNVAEEVEGWSYSLEALLQNDPDYIIVRREDSATFVGMKPYATMRAVRENHVIGIVSGMLDLQVPRNIDAITYIHNRIHPTNP